MIKHILRNHRQLLALSADTRAKNKTLPLWGWIVSSLIMHAILVWTSIECGFTDWRFVRKCKRLLDKHDREMRKMGYTGP